MTTTRLTAELRLLFACERDSQLPAAPVIRQLVAWEDGRLPDQLPLIPHWTSFAWPISGSVDFTDYWRARDRDRLNKWSGPYL